MHGNDRTRRSIEQKEEEIFEYDKQQLHTRKAYVVPVERQSLLTISQLVATAFAINVYILYTHTHDTFTSIHMVTHML